MFRRGASGMGRRNSRGHAGGGPPESPLVGIKGFNATARYEGPAAGAPLGGHTMDICLMIRRDSVGNCWMVVHSNGTSRGFLVRTFSSQLQCLIQRTGGFITGPVYTWQAGDVGKWHIFLFRADGTDIRLYRYLESTDSESELGTAVTLFGTYVNPLSYGFTVGNRAGVGAQPDAYHTYGGVGVNQGSNLNTSQRLAMYRSAVANNCLPASSFTHLWCGNDNEGARATWTPSAGGVILTKSGADQSLVVSETVASPVWS